MDSAFDFLAAALEKIDFTWWQITVFSCAIIFLVILPKLGRIRNERLKITHKFDALEARAERDWQKFEAKRAAKALAKPKKEK